MIIVKQAKKEKTQPKLCSHRVPGVSAVNINIAFSKNIKNSFVSLQIFNFFPVYFFL